MINAASLRYYFQSGKFADAGKLYSQIAAQNPNAAARCMSLIPSAPLKLTHVLPPI
jgi:hypothetical protein